MRLAIGFGSIALLSMVSNGATGAPVLQGLNSCNSGGAACLFFTQAGTAFTVRNLDFKAPAAGKALVSVTGSGVCTNNADAIGVADFETEVVNNPAAAPAYDGPGGNRFRFTLPARSPSNLSGNGVFNLASERLFTIKKAGTQHFVLRAIGDRIDASVECDVLSVAMSVLFIPG